jgi:hypothetical protein
VFSVIQLMHSSLFDPSEAVGTTRESCKATPAGSAKPAFGSHESSSFSENPQTFLAFTSRF